MATQDALETDNIVERVQRQRRDMAEKGVLNYGGRAYGYEPWSGRKHGGAGSTPTVRESEAKVIGELARRILRGDTTYAVAKWANQNGHRTVRGKKFRAIDIRRHLLVNPRIAGIAVYKGEWVSTKAQWPAIVPMEQWQEVRRVLSRTAGRPGGGRQPLSLLSGLLYCGECQSRLLANSDRYRCANTGVCNVSRRSADVESFVVEQWGEHMTKLSGTDQWVPERVLTAEAVPRVERVGRGTTSTP